MADRLHRRIQPLRTASCRPTIAITSDTRSTGSCLTYQNHDRRWTISYAGRPLYRRSRAALAGSRSHAGRGRARPTRVIADVRASRR